MQQIRKIENGTCVQHPNTTQDEYIVERPGYSYITLPCDVTYELPDAIEHAYPGFYNTGALSEFDQQHSAISCARNRQVDEINNAMHVMGVGRAYALASPGRMVWHTHSPAHHE